jgi:hypothetical protein
MTPESSESGLGHFIPPSAMLMSSQVSTTGPALLSNHTGIDVWASQPGQVSGALPDASAHWIQGPYSHDGHLPNQIIDQVLGFSSPSLHSIPTPNETFQDLMRVPLDASTYQSPSSGQLLSDMRDVEQDLDLVSPQPETWINLCLYTNVLLGQGWDAEARHAMTSAALIYQRLVAERNDQLLSILNLVLALLFSYGKERLAAEFLSQALQASSTYLDHADPITVSIRFMVSMALKNSKSCGIEIQKLRQVATEMRMLWGEDHRYCITADYHLAWRLAMESDMRCEALRILCDTQARSERVFGPLHMQTVAFITTRARVLGHLGHLFEAETTMSEALQRIERWKIKKDYPYYLEAKRRHKIFLETLDRFKSQ